VSSGVGRGFAPGRGQLLAPTRSGGSCRSKTEISREYRRRGGAHILLGEKSNFMSDAWKKESGMNRPKLAQGG
jgi:hypothetical protein